MPSKFKLEKQGIKIKGNTKEIPSEINIAGTGFSIAEMKPWQA